MKFHQKPIEMNRNLRKSLKTLGLTLLLVLPAAGITIQDTAAQDITNQTAEQDHPGSPVLPPGEEAAVQAATSGEPQALPNRPEELETLQQYYMTAVENNPELASVRSAYEAQYQRANQMGVLPDPEVGVGYFINPSGDTDFFGRFSVSAMQMFPWFGTLSARESSAENMGDAQRHRWTARQLEIFHEIQQVWLEYAEIQLSIEATEEIIELIRDLEALVETRYETGRVSQADMLRIQMEEDRLETRLENLMDQLNPLQEQFQAVLGVEEPVDIEIPDRLPGRQVDHGREELFRLALQQNPEFDRLSSARQSYRQQEELARLEGRPSFGVGVEMMGRDFTTMSMMPDMNESFVGMASIKIPLYRSRYEAKQEEARLEIRRTEQAEQNVSNRLVSNLESALNSLRDARRNEELITDRLLPKTEQALEILSEEYASGRASFDEVLQLQRELLDLELELIGELTRQNKAMATIEKLTGFDR